MRRFPCLAFLAILLLAPAAAQASLDVESAFLRLLTPGGPTGNERILWSGKFSINLSDTNGIAPGTEDLVFTLESFVADPENPDGGSFVQQYSVVLPAGGLQSTDGGVTWSLAPDAATTLETLDVTAVPGGGFMVDLLDRHATLSDVDYGRVRVTLAIGDDAGSVESALVQSGNQWLIAPSTPAPAPAQDTPTQSE